MSPRPTLHRLAAGPALALLLLGSGCTTIQMAPAADKLPGTSAHEPETQDVPAFIGLELEESLAGTLDELAFQPGLSVVSVTRGSPAQLAGLRRGDRVVAADGVELERADQWAAMIAARQIGDTLELRIERDSGLVDVEVTVAPGGGGTLPAPTTFVEHWKGRVVVQSRVVERDGAEEVVAEVLELLPESPLAEHDVTPGTLILAADGRRVGGAEGLVALLARADFGAKVELELERAGERETVKVKLWSPPSHMTKLSIPILYYWEATPDGDQTEWSFLDIWILSLFAYERDGTTKTYKFLSIFQFQSGTGELEDVTDEETAGAGS